MDDFLKDARNALLVIVAVMVLLSIGFLVFLFAGAVPQDDTKVRILQISMTIPLSLVLIAMGIAVSWIGITAAMKLNAQAHNMKLALSTASPGFILVLGGVFVLASVIWKPFTNTNEEITESFTTNNTDGSSTTKTLTKVKRTTVFDSTKEGIQKFWDEQDRAYRKAQESKNDGQIKQWYNDYKSQLKTRSEVTSALRRFTADKTVAKMDDVYAALLEKAGNKTGHDLSPDEIETIFLSAQEYVQNIK